MTQEKSEKGNVGRDEASARFSDVSGALPTEGDLDQLEPEAVESYLNQLHGDYNKILEDLHRNSQASARQFKEFSNSGRKWRFWLILLTGFVAILNSAAALSLFSRVRIGAITDASVAMAMTPDTEISSSAEALGSANEHVITLAAILTIIAALVAVLATVIGNIENFLAFPERASRKREAREIFFSAYWKYHSRWKYSVVVFGSTPTAAANASALYADLVQEHIEIRKYVGEMLGHSDESRQRGGQ